MAALLALAWLLAALAAAEPPPFRLPAGFEGTWQGVPYASALGVWSHNMTFAISRADDGDYLMVTNLKYDADPDFDAYWSWQRSYIRSSGEWRGDITHCPGPRSPFLKRQAMMQVHREPKPDDRNVTFCLKKWEGYDELNHPFPFKSLQCYTEGAGPGCGCFNWTLQLDDAGEVLNYHVSFAGTPGFERTQHLWARFQRIGPPPPIELQMPGGGQDFRCEYGGRDGHIVDSGHIAHCPFGMPYPALGPHREPVPVPSALRFQSSFEHCYVLNEKAGVVLEWGLDAARAQLTVQLSASAKFGGATYVAIGFRPLGGASTAWARDHGTGRERRFGMAGADIVLGHGAGGLLKLHAVEYTGPPEPDDSLPVTEPEVSLANGRVSLRFTRPLVGGRLHALYGVNASITSNVSDVLWAVGRMDGDFPLNHGRSRGWREVNWTDPEHDARPLLSLRPYKCVSPATAARPSGAAALLRR